MRTPPLTFTGYGDIYQGDRWLAWGSYSIRTWWETGGDPAPRDPAAEVEGVTEYAYGLLRVLRGDLNLPQNTTCSLELADGRRCHVYFTLIGDPSIDNYTVHFEDVGELG